MAASLTPAQTELAQRLGVGVGLAAIALLCAWAGGLAFLALIAFFAALAAMEWIDLYKRARKRETAVAWGLGALYIGLPAFSLIWLRAQPFGLQWIEYLFAAVWASDIAAYAVGRSFGRAKLWPAISPGKTWAGFWGANAAAAAVGAVMAGYVGIPAGAGALLGLVLALLAQAGDLFESWMKRKASVKDSGDLLPGHGGVLDRLDSLVPVAPAVAALVFWSDLA